MATPRLHPDTIEQVKQRADIYDIVSEHVVLKKQGKDYVGLCPFHDEKTGSFNVIPSKQMYYCFGCAAAGNAINFLMEINQRSFSDVVLDLAKRYAVPVQTVEPEKRQELQRQISMREQLYEILAITTSFYQHALNQPQGKPALDYLQNQRQFSRETIQKFQLGYAPAGWESLYNYLIDLKHFPVQLVEQAGLIVPRKNGTGYYDRFRDRLMIPIYDIQGRVIGFGGRTLTDELPKYLNSPETELFDKSKILFCLDKAKSAISKQDKAVVVEGYFDALSLHAAGITNVVASLGTALSLDQVRLLLRYSESKRIVLNFDADKAGTSAAERAIGEIASFAYRGEVQLRILNIPDGKDADEFLKTYSPEKYLEILQDAPLWLDWQIQQLLSGKDLKQADNYQLVARDMVKLLCNITEDNQLTHYLNNCADFLSLGDSSRVRLLADNLLEQVVNRCRDLLQVEESRVVAPLVANRLQKNKRPIWRTKAFNQTEKASSSPVSESTLLEEAEATLLRIYLHSPEYRHTIIQELDQRDLQFNLSHHRFLWQKIQSLEIIDISSVELISKLQDLYLEAGEKINPVSDLFHLDEKANKDILRGSLAIRRAAASIERVMCEKRCRMFRNEFMKINPETHPEEAKFYQEQWYSEIARIKELDRQRETPFNELIQTPII